MPKAARIGDPFTCGDFIAAGSPNVFVNGIPFARLHDATTGHGCWNPNMLIEAARSVFANNIPVCYIGHHNQVHCCPPPCHQGTVKDASPNTFVEDPA